MKGWFLVSLFLDLIIGLLVYCQFNGFVSGMNPFLGLIAFSLPCLFIVLNVWVIIKIKRQGRTLLPLFLFLGILLITVLLGLKRAKELTENMGVPRRYYSTEPTKP